MADRMKRALGVLCAVLVVMGTAGESWAQAPPPGDGGTNPPPGDGTNPPPGDGTKPPLGGTLPTFAEWSIGLESGDLDGDEDIDEDDYKIFLDEVLGDGPGGFEEPGRPGSPGRPGNPGAELVFSEWVDRPEAIDLDGDLDIDEEDFKLFIDEVLGDGPGGFEGPGRPGDLSPELFEFLASLLPEFEDDPELFIPLEDLELDDRALNFLAAEVGDGLTLETLEHLLSASGGPGGPGPLFELLEELAEDFEDDPGLLIDLEDLIDELDDPGAVDFLSSLAGFDGLLSADEVFSIVQAGPPGGDGNFPRLGRIEGILEGLDLEEGLIFVNGEEFEPAGDLQVFDRDGQPIDVFTLLEVAGSFPKVEMELNEDDEIVLLRVLSRIEGGAVAGHGEEFFGPLALIDEGKIIFKGPHFQVTERTRFLDQNNKKGSLEDAPLGQPVSVTPGPPDPNSDSFDPTVTKVQLINPNRPPPASANIIVGNLIAFDDETLELAGPISEWNLETVFTDHEGQTIDPLAIESGTFLRVVTRPPQFGEGQPVAVQVEVLEDGTLGPPLAEENQRGRPQDEIRIEGFIADVGDDFIVLEGVRILLDDRFLLLDVDGQETDPENVFPGDLLEIDTRPDHRRGFVATRAKLIAPAAQGFDHPGVITAPFEAIEDGELILAGPFFAFASELKIAGQGGRRIEVNELENIEYVRLTASPPRFDRGETLPVVFDIRVAKALEEFAPPEDDDFNQPGAKHRVRSSFPEDGDVEIPLFTEVEVSFDGNVSELLFDPEFEFSIFPEPLSFGELQIGTDGRTLSAEIELGEDRSYQLVVISKATGFHSVRFSTGEQIAISSIAGRILPPEDLPNNARFIEGESFAVLIEGVGDGEIDNFKISKKMWSPVFHSMVKTLPLRPSIRALTSSLPLSALISGAVGLSSLRPYMTKMAMANLMPSNSGPTSALKWS